MHLSRRFLSSFVIISFLATSVLSSSRGYAAPPSVLGLPVPGAMVSLSPAYVPVLIKGLTLHPENPLLFDFIIDTGTDTLEAQSAKLKAEALKLIKYFLATLTIPEKDLWVNLSPYEKDRMVPQELGQTEMGRDMLAQDYMLKQLTASLIYPEKELGKKFWDRVYDRIYKEYSGTPSGDRNPDFLKTIPVNVGTFNKVWILPDKAGVFVRNNTVYVVEGHLKVMLEEDYLALEKNELSPTLSLTKRGGQSDSPSLFSKRGLGGVASDIVRDIILPEIEKEVNQGKHFAPLRQIFYSLVLASWYKKNLKDALLNQVYSDKNKVNGVHVDDKDIGNKIYQQYLAAYKKGVFNYIKEDVDSLNKQVLPRKYFSGGLLFRVNPQEVSPAMVSPAMLNPTGSLFRVQASTPPDAAMASGNGATGKADVKFFRDTYNRLNREFTDLKAIDPGGFTDDGLKLRKDTLALLRAESQSLVSWVTPTSDLRKSDSKEWADLVEDVVALWGKVNQYLWESPNIADRATITPQANLTPISIEVDIGEWKMTYPNQNVLKLAQALDLLIKEYDIRGFDGFGSFDGFPVQMDPVLIRWLGRALGTAQLYSKVHDRTVGLKEGDDFVIGGDNGPSTHIFFNSNFIEGLRDTGVNVIDVGTVVSGELFSNISRFNAAGGAHTTRSHTEIGIQGNKQMIGGITLYGEMLQALKPLILAGQYRKPKVRGNLIQGDEIRSRSRKLYLDSLRDQFGSLKQLLDATPMDIVLNFNGGAAAQVDYVEFFKNILGPHLAAVLRPTSDPWNENGGLADPSRDDELALAHPKADIVKYSKEHSGQIIFSVDLDTDRVGVLWNGRLYLGDSMFLPVIEYMLTLDPYKDLSKTFYFDTRMSMQFRQLVEAFGGTAKVHPKGHSKVKATMDVMLKDLAKKEGLNFHSFLQKYPGFRLLQAEYSLHLFSTNQLGEPGDDAFRFILVWIEIFTKLRNHHHQSTWTLEQYINSLLTRNLIKPVSQLNEQRTSIPEEVKKTLMSKIQEHVLAFLGQQQGQIHFEPDWNKFNGTSKPFTLIDVDGVYYLRTSTWEIFWGWSNTSAKDAFGAQATNIEDLRKISGVLVALWVHTRNELNSSLPKINDAETRALRTLFGLNSAAAVEAMAIALYPTMRAALEGLNSAMVSKNNDVSQVNPGGIDFNPANLSTSTTGDKIDIRFDQAMVAQFKRGDFTGVRPVILSVTPIPSILPLLGLSPAREEDSVLVKAGV